MQAYGMRNLPPGMGPGPNSMVLLSYRMLNS
jgi:hypothetical protein